MGARPSLPVDTSELELAQLKAGHRLVYTLHRRSTEKESNTRRTDVRGCRRPPPDCLRPYCLRGWRPWGSLVQGSLQ